MEYLIFSSDCKYIATANDETVISYIDMPIPFSILNDIYFNLENGKPVRVNKKIIIKNEMPVYDYKFKKKS